MAYNVQKVDPYFQESNNERIVMGKVVRSSFLQNFKFPTKKINLFNTT